jgi:hypothetical protein
VKLITIAVNVTLGAAAVAVMLGTVRWRDRIEAERGLSG